MSSTRSPKTTGATVRIPNQRGRRSAQPFVIVVPERPSLSREAAGFLGRALWSARRALAPMGLALLAFALTGLLHAIAWWSGLVLAPVAVAPALWLGITQVRHPAKGWPLVGRAGLALLATLALVWLTLAALFGPLAGPLELWWLLSLIGAQTSWFFVRRTH